jgi:hypothetical protein
MTIDLATLDVSAASETPVEVELLHPATKEGLGQFVSIIGRESKTCQSYLRAKNNEAMRKAVLNSRKSRTPLIPTSEENEAEAVELLSGVITKGFRNLNYKGVELVYTPDAAKTLYTEQPWIAEQVDRAMADLTLFFTV